MLATIHMLAAEGPNGRFFPSDIKEFWWGTFAFLVIASLLVKKVGPLIKKGLANSQAKAIAQATAADQAIAASRAKIAEATAQLGDADAESAQILADATTTAQQLRVDSANRTQQLVNDLWAKAQIDVAAMKAQAHADMTATVTSQAFGAAEEVVLSNLDAGRQSALIDDYITSLGASK